MKRAFASPALTRGALAALLTSLVCVGVLAESPIDFGFASHGGPIRGASEGDARLSLDPASCGRCHTEIFEEWSGSMHARSFVDPVFRAELAQTADGTVCRTCHAPLANAAVEGGAMHDVGVACAACHVRGDAILSVRARSARSPHRTRVVAELDSARFCASCHDFFFPDLGGGRAIPYDPDTRQQSTLQEWRASEHAREGRSCVSCHMPERTRARGHVGTSHALRSLEDRAFVQDALAVEATLEAGATHLRLHLRITTKGAGHAVPTGDIFRALRVRAWNGRGEAERILRRNFAEQHTARGWVLRDAYDDRVLPGETKHVVLELPLGGGEVRYALEILRLELRDARLRALPESLVVVPITEGVARTARAE